MLLAVDLHEYFINVEGIAVAPVLSLQAAGINGSELDTPETNRFSADGDAALSEQIFNISVAEIEAIVKPNGVTNDVRRESVAFIGIHPPILSASGG
jgi:hypothetical protein